MLLESSKSKLSKERRPDIHRHEETSSRTSHFLCESQPQITNSQAGSGDSTSGLARWIAFRLLKMTQNDHANHNIDDATIILMRNSDDILHSNKRSLSPYLLGLPTLFPYGHAECCGTSPSAYPSGYSPRKGETA